MNQFFDAIVIGAGQAGPSLAGRLTAAGMKVALIERNLFGGTCVNTGCMPTKTLVASAYAAHLARQSAEYGVAIESPINIDMKRVKARADTVSTNARTGVETWLRGMDGLTVMEGHARFDRPDAVRVGESLLKAPRIFINIGGRASVPAMPGVGTVEYLTNTSILKLDTIPRHLIVVGGSYIGIEFAQMYRRFGAKVTVIEKGARLIAREDEDVSEAVREILTDEGVVVRTNATCIGFKPHADGLAVNIDCTSGEPFAVGSHVLLAVGRRPNTDDLGLDKAGVTVDARGYVVVDDLLATNVRGIWALGDCNGRGAFTHTAYNDYEIVAANLLDGANRRVIPARVKADSFWGFRSGASQTLWWRTGGSPCGQGLRFAQTMMRPGFGHWRKRAGTRGKVGGCWRWPRSTMAAPGPKRRGSAASGCSRFGTGLCGSTPTAPAA